MGKRQQPKYFYEPFEGVNNIEALVIQKLIENCEYELNMLNEKLQIIQANCSHEYYLVCTGVLEDTFQCKLCGGLVYR